MTKKYIIISCVCIFLLAPLAAWLVVAINNTSQIPKESVSEMGKDELLNALRNNHAHSHLELTDDSQKHENEMIDIVSYERIDEWWYVVVVKMRSDSDRISERPVILSRFTENPESIRVVTTPGRRLFHYNISNGLGIPYDVIDKFNKIDFVGE